jgi:hypothetical protein
VRSYARSIPDHCLAQLGVKLPIDAPLASVHYARMFLEIPAFRSEEKFLRALGRVGGVCDCEAMDDTPKSLADTATGWPILASSSPTTSQPIVRACGPIRTPPG